MVAGSKVGLVVEVVVLGLLSRGWDGGSDMKEGWAILSKGSIDEEGNCSGPDCTASSEVLCKVSDSVLVILVLEQSAGSGVLRGEGSVIMGGWKSGELWGEMSFTANSCILSCDVMAVGQKILSEEKSE